jgi:hypothetical protein
MRTVIQWWYLSMINGTGIIRDSFQNFLNSLHTLMSTSSHCLLFSSVLPTRFLEQRRRSSRRR